MKKVSDAKVLKKWGSFVFFSLITKLLSCWHYFWAINLGSLYQMSWMLTLHLRIRYTFKKEKNQVNVQVNAQYMVDCYFHYWKSWLATAASWNVPSRAESPPWIKMLQCLPMALKIKGKFQVWTGITWNLPTSQIASLGTLPKFISSQLLTLWQFKEHFCLKAYEDTFT